MSDVNWRREMREMLLNIDRHATFSLRRIGRSFGQTGRSFNDEFRQLFTQMTNERLATTYSRVQMELLNVNEGENDGAQREAGASVPQSSTSSAHDFGSVKQEATHEDDAHAQSNQNDSLLVMESIENELKREAEDLNVVVEIYGSSDEENIDEAIGEHSRKIKAEKEEDDSVNSGNANKSGSNESINQNGDEERVKEEFDIEPKQEMFDDDIPVRRFNPNDVSSNGGYSTSNDAAKGNDAGSALRSKSGKKKTGAVDESDAQKPSCSKGTKRFDCELCKYGTNQKGNLKKHVRSHSNEKPYRCIRCTKCFTDSSHLKRHETTHKDQFPFHCSNCFRGFFQKNEKETHEKNCRKRRYECFICKYVTEKTNLVRHMRTHSGNKPYRCSRCSKGFIQLWDLKRHMTTHKDKNLPFHCKGCCRRFSSKNGKDVHESGCRYRRYECHLCKKYVTGIKTHMENHMRTHTGEKPFRCEVCMKCFTEKGHLKRHLNTVHSRRT